MRTIAVLGFGFIVFSAPACAIDCAKARTDDDLAICKSPDLLAMDRSLNDSYVARLNTFAAAERQQLKLAQSIWLREKQECSGDAACVGGVLASRRNLLQGKPTTAVGVDGNMQPFFNAYEDVNWYVAEGLRFADPQSPFMAEWNRKVDEAVAVFFGPSAVANNPGDIRALEVSDPANPSYGKVTADVTYFSSTLFSGTIYKEEYESGAAHPNWVQYNVNLRVEDGVALQLDDLFSPGSDLKLIETCAIQVAEGEPLDADERRILASTVTDLDNWTIENSGAAITFESRTLRSGLPCRLSDVQLRSFVRPEWEVWQKQ